MTAQAARPIVAAVTTATADSALAANRQSLRARSRWVVIPAALLALAGVGFATARSVAEHGGARPVRVCSEICGPLSTTGEPAPGGGKETR